MKNHLKPFIASGINKLWADGTSCGLAFRVRFATEKEALAFIARPNVTAGAVEKAN